MMRIKGRQEADFSIWFCTAAYQGTVAFCPEPLVKATEDPVSRAVMRHMGVDPSSDKAQQCRGIVVIVHGAPRAGM